MQWKDRNKENWGLQEKFCASYEEMFVSHSIRTLWASSKLLSFVRKGRGNNKTRSIVSVKRRRAHSMRLTMLDKRSMHMSRLFSNVPIKSFAFQSQKCKAQHAQFVLLSPLTLTSERTDEWFFPLLQCNQSIKTPDPCLPSLFNYPCAVFDAEVKFPARHRLFLFLIPLKARLAPSFSSLL
jgi:hypothetical protein